jgi:hypothetical protein
LSMPALCSSWPSNSPAGPAPMIATCVRCMMLVEPEVRRLGRA